MYTETDFDEGIRLRRVANQERWLAEFETLSITRNYRKVRGSFVARDEGSLPNLDFEFEFPASIDPESVLVWLGQWLADEENGS